MEIKAELKDIRVTPRKMKLLISGVSKFKLEEMLEKLQMLNKTGARELKELINSGVANAVNNFQLKKENLKIKELSVRPAGVMKRFRAASRGVAHGYKKRMSHIKIILEG